MKCLHFDIVSGIAGDMTVAALLHLGASIEPLRQALGSMGLSDVRMEVEDVQRQGIGARKFSVVAEETHPHRSYRDVQALLAVAGLSPGAHRRAEAIFGCLAEAEAIVHGSRPEEVVFHEVGAVDSIADVVGCALALEQLAPEQITASPPLLGKGMTRSHHGPIPVPAPATLELLRGIPSRGLDVEAELTTPTGAAILASQVDRFTSWPDMVIQAIGYGAGTRELEGRPNVLRAVLGEVHQRAVNEEILVEANIDDMNPEHFEHLLEALLEAGAHDVWLQPVIMKKSRPGVTLSLLCDEPRLDALEGIVFRESTTIGVRRQAVTRRKLARRRETVTTPYGQVRVKISGEGSETLTVAPEYTDCRERAREHRVALKSVYQAALDAWRERD